MQQALVMLHRLPPRIGHAAARAGTHFSMATYGNITINAVEALFNYVPNETAAWSFFGLYVPVIAAITYITCFVAPHARYMHYATITGLMEMIGYGVRVAAMRNPTLGPYIASIFFLLVPPIVLALVNYSALSVLLRAVGKSVLLPPRLIATTFLLSDVASFLVQSTGGGIMVSTDVATAQAGQRLVFAGLALQLVSFTVFLAMSVAAFCMPELHPRTSRIPRITTVWAVLWLTLLGLYVRNVYRVVEFSYVLEPSAYVTSHEWPFYVFDTILIYCICIAYAVWHFGVYLPADTVLQELISSKGASQAHAPVEPDVGTQVARAV